MSVMMNITVYGMIGYKCSDNRDFCQDFDPKTQGCSFLPEPNDSVSFRPSERSERRGGIQRKCQNAKRFVLCFFKIKAKGCAF